ncbi:hypothetical protein [Streptomyces sp. NPDC004976]
MQSATHRDLIELEAHPAATFVVFLDAPPRFRPHIVHFAGHRAQDLIAFEKDEDRRHEGATVSAGAFADAIAAADDKSLLVLLNSHSAAQTANVIDTHPLRHRPVRLYRRLRTSTYAVATSRTRCGCRRSEFPAQGRAGCLMRQHVRPGPRSAGVGTRRRVVSRDSLVKRPVR